jgi:hypothetical protein
MFTMAILTNVEVSTLMPRHGALREYIWVESECQVRENLLIQ